jgi:hypothetical protein
MFKMMLMLVGTMFGMIAIEAAKSPLSSYNNTMVCVLIVWLFFTFAESLQ